MFNKMLYTSLSNVMHSRCEEEPSYPGEVDLLYDTLTVVLFGFH